MGRVGAVRCLLVGVAMSVVACGSPAPTSSPGSAAPPSVEPVAITLTAVNIAFEPAKLGAPAGRPLEITLDNQDQGVPHNLTLLAGPGFAVELATSEVVTGPAKIPLSVPGLVPGAYRFMCKVHPNMVADLTIDGG